MTNDQMWTNPNDQAGSGVLPRLGGGRGIAAARAAGVITGEASGRGVGADRGWGEVNVAGQRTDPEAERAAVGVRGGWGARVKKTRCEKRRLLESDRGVARPGISLRRGGSLPAYPGDPHPSGGKKKSKMVEWFPPPAGNPQG